MLPFLLCKSSNFVIISFKKQLSKTTNMWEDPNKHKTIQRIAYVIIYSIWYTLSCLPLRVLYLLSDVVAFILYHIVGYRRKVVSKNIHDSYPNLSEDECKSIERKFYRHFCDLLIESLKYFSMSEKEVKRRLQFKGIELIEESYNNGRSCGIFLGHYGNFEWTSSMPLWVDHNRCQCVQFYRRLDNKVLNRILEHQRDRWGSVNVPANESVRYLARYRKEGKPFIIGFAADQTPWWRDIHYWTNFLNHPETPVFTGAERIMRKFDMDVYYLDITRVKRGKYIAEYKRITTTPNEHPEFWITEQYTRMMEETINRAPAYWLWSHNRWKRTKEEWIRITGGK